MFMSKRVIGEYPNAFVVREAEAYFKQKKNNGHIDKNYENTIRHNFKTEKDFLEFVEYLENK